MDMTLEEYFKLHPDEEDEYYDAMAELHSHDEPVDYPEDWQLREAEYWRAYAYSR